MRWGCDGRGAAAALAPDGHLGDTLQVRFCVEKYSASSSKMKEKFRHITNYTVQKENAK